MTDLITSMGGSISAEHGIGIDKLDELSHYRSKTELTSCAPSSAQLIRRTS